MRKPTKKQVEKILNLGCLETSYHFFLQNYKIYKNFEHDLSRQIVFDLGFAQIAFQKSFGNIDKSIYTENGFDFSKYPNLEYKHLVNLEWLEK